MKREIAAGLVLLLLAIGSWFNLNYLREFTGGLEEQLALLHRDIAGFAAGAEQADDITMLLIQINKTTGRDGHG